MGIVSRSQGGGGASVPLFDSTLLADAASIDTGAAGIAGGQNVLEVWILTRTDEAVVESTALITVNNDTGANYDKQQISGSNVTLAAAPVLASANWSVLTAGNTAPAGNPGVTRLTIPGYAQTVFNKAGELASGHLSSVAGDNRLLLHAIGWRNTAAISRMKVAPGGGTVLRAGSRLLILGR